MMRILIIDDDALVGRALGRMLRAHVVTVELDPRRAMQIAEEQEGIGRPFDVVLCDENLPGKGGREVTSILRARLDPPILILMSADARVLSAVHDADAVLLKPFKATELVALIAEAVQRRASPRIATLVANSGALAISH
jgi:DNA-binding response OmpR family regulator